MRRVLTTVTLLGLLVATAAAFAITEHLKLEKSPIYGTRIFSGRPGTPTLFSPVCGPDCATRSAKVQIRLRHTGRVTVTIVDSQGREVATIAPDVLMQARTPRSFVWDGRTDSGVRVPDGVYYAWVQLPRRTFKFINKITVDTIPPKVVSAARVKRSPVFFAGAGRTVAIRYTFTGPAHALVYLGGRQIILGRSTQARGKVKWTGRLTGSALRPGTYVLSVGAQDKAGNVAPASARKDVTVVVRYIQLAPGRVAVRRGGRLAFSVRTAARRYAWRLGRRHGARRGKVLRLRAPTTPGTYRLVVTENGHTSTAVVRVRGK